MSEDMNKKELEAFAAGRASRDALRRAADIVLSDAWKDKVADPVSYHKRLQRGLRHHRVSENAMAFLREAIAADDASQ